MNKRLYITLSLATLLCTSCAEKPTASNVEADRQAVEKVIEQYVSVINTCDTALCGQIWSHGEEVSFIAPSGHYTSYEAIRDSLVVGLFGTRFTQRELRKKSVKITVNGQEVTGNTITLSGTPAAGETSMVISISIYGTEPVSGSGQIVVNNGSDDMSLTDILLIVLVVLIVIMAVIVALRLMRS